MMDVTALQQPVHTLTKHCFADNCGAFCSIKAGTVRRTLFCIFVYEVWDLGTYLKPITLLRAEAVFLICCDNK
jgi:hypothetical protein